jgi:exopolysaccharide biosynthesis protein
LKDKAVDFTVDTSKGRRLTPSQFYTKNNQPLVVVNTTFFSFETNANLNLVMRNGKVLAYNQHSIPLRGKDTFKYAHVFPSAIGISRNRTADVAWVWNKSRKKVFASLWPVHWIDKNEKISEDSIEYHAQPTLSHMEQLSTLYSWKKMKTAVGGGPVLLSDGEIKITNNEERKFAGKAINDKHPRTAMGYTKDNKLIILVVQGRFPGVAEGATLTQEAQILEDLGCYEALNLDGGGSSCMLVNGKETIKPSDKAGVQRAVPAVFIITTGR